MDASCSGPRELEKKEQLDGEISGTDVNTSLDQITHHTSFQEEQDRQANDETENTDNENDKLEEENLEILSKSEETMKTEKVIDLNEIKKFGKKVDQTGLIYISRIPPGMGPSKLKHLLSKWGQIGRIYLARDEKAEESKRHKKNSRKKSVEKHQSFLFKEGWVEFMDKKVARRVAEMLNTRPIGGKPSEKYHSDLWSLTYLPKFKWTNLSDQMAVERRIKEQLIRNSLEDSKKSQEWYLNMVEKNSTNQKIHQKQLKRNPSSSTSKVSNKGKNLEFKQRELPVGLDSNQTIEQNPKLKSVLNGLL